MLGHKLDPPPPRLWVGVCDCCRGAGPSSNNTTDPHPERLARSASLGCLCTKQLENRVLQNRPHLSAAQSKGLGPFHGAAESSSVRNASESFLPPPPVEGLS